MRRKIVPKVLGFSINKIVGKKLTTHESNPTFPRINARKWWFSDGKNWVILNAKELVDIFLIYSIQMK